MKRSAILVLVLSCLFILSLPFASFADDKKGGYITIKPGAYFPTGDLNDKGFDNSFTGELTVGTYYTPNLALEAGVGYFQTEASKHGEDDDVWVVPVTITFKGVLPLKGAELTAGAGGGVYFANIDAKGSDLSGHFSRDDSAVVAGAHVVAGVNVDVAPKIFLGVEGKYIVTTGADMLGGHVNLNGFMLTGVLGYRF